MQLALGVITDTTCVTLDDCSKITFTAGSAVIKGKFYYTSKSDADAAKVTADTAFGTPAAASVAIGYPVQEVKPVKVEAVAGNYEINFAQVGGIGGGALVLLLITIGAAIWVSKNELTKRSIAPTGCCSTGCCSYYANPSWNWTLLFGVVFLAISTVFLFLGVEPVKDKIICLIDGIYELQEIGKNLTAVKEVADNLPTEFIDPVRSRLNLLDIAVILPAAISGVLVILSAALSFRTTPCKMVFAKIFATLTYLFLILSFVLYIIFAALAIVINYSEAAKLFVNIAVSICEDNVPTWEQTLTDAKSARDRAKTGGMDTSSYDQQISDWEPAVASLSGTCSCLTDLFNLLPALFVPGAATTLCVLYLFISNFSWCCSAKCCTTPPINGDAAGATISKTSTQESTSSDATQSV